jgi:hypothetical protein
VDFVGTLYVCLVTMELGIKNFQSFAVICRKPNAASSIRVRAKIFQNPEWILWTLYVCLVIMEFEWDKKTSRVSL